MVQAGVGPFQSAPGFPQTQSVGADGLSVAVAVKSTVEPMTTIKSDVTQQNTPGTQVCFVIMNLNLKF